MEADKTRVKFTGELEVDLVRGVAYFHSDNPTVIEAFGTQTLLRVQGLTIVPGRQIDVRALPVGAVAASVPGYMLRGERAPSIVEP